MKQSATVEGFPPTGSWPAVSLLRICGVAVLLIGIFAFRGLWSPQPRATFSLSGMPRLNAKPLASDEAGTAGTIRFLSQKVRRDPEDFVAQNMLASYFLQKTRETLDAADLRRATDAARASLASVPPLRNAGGLSAMAHAEFAAHEFVAARDHATLLTQLEPQKGASWSILGDILIELGDYDGATSAFDRMRHLGYSGTAAQTRLARMALLRGDPGTAYRHLVRGLALVLDLPVPPRETVAWCYWQLGEVAFSVGDYTVAEEQYRAALTAYPGYLNALPSLGRVRAARGDLRGAIENYQHAVRIIPDLAFVATLGDLYALAGSQNEARSQYGLVEQIGRLAKVNGAASNRPLILFHADHNIKTDEAYREALDEYKVRRDIYGADAVAWSALKSERLAEAQAAMKSALRLGTQDARLFYHAGMIARASGDDGLARKYLERVRKLNPEFDPVQAREVTKALAR